ncbi:hypothetical protein AKJ62_01130 [candidate division MSBL1 archaeon SCGC-AAA259D14]|uniref:Uncharacterized protein n=1 Tax=candidate division MSBL1 archaeon SCGC-AAA259D14 TaxID=1698261 RepID=A0A133U828_9EURY|nr:hypothetical protein AKJ62_01130 [candidate division MSBL1 archaeon SCGC-AAA259D14]
MVKVVECELCGKKIAKPPKHTREKRGGMICRDCYAKTGDEAENMVKNFLRPSSNNDPETENLVENVMDKTADFGEALEETEMDDPMKDPDVLEKAEDHLRSQLELAEAAGDEDAEQQLLETLTLISQDKKELQRKEENRDKS